jgi:GntR family transcriptional regulator/MocR family aminotransferase
VICSGFAQGLNLVLRALADSGVRKVAFEDPGYNATAAAACAAAAVCARTAAPPNSISWRWPR